MQNYQQENKAESVWSADQAGYGGAEPSTIETMDDETQNNSSGKVGILTVATLNLHCMYYSSFYFK